MIPVFLDCDTGIDDSLALLYLLGRPDVDLVGIASTAGNVPVDVVTENNLAWLSLVDRTSIPVHRGAAEPLACALMTTEDTHGPRGVGYAELPPAVISADPVGAADAWIAASHAHAGALVGIVTGPSTSLAQAIRRDPTLPRRLSRLVIMGGAFHVHGNTTPTSEWNVAVDPEAAAEVFAAFGAAHDAPDPIVCALDLTETIALRPAHIVRLAQVAGAAPVETLAETDARGRRSASDNPVIRHLTDAFRFYLEFHRDHDEGWIAHMHDPFAALVALDPAIVTTRAAHIDVELTGTLTRGTTVADERSHWGGRPNALIAVAVDAEAVLTEVIDIVGGLARDIGHRPAGGGGET